MSGPREAVRSPHWPALERGWIAQHPTCAACGKGKRLLWRQLDVHHVKPVHLFPELELDETNLITLCRGLGMNKADQHHLWIGHWGDWRSWNPNVRVDAARLLAGGKP